MHAELPFLLPVGGSIVRGIDVLADTERGPLVIDYKTDSLTEATPNRLDRYAVQREIYALAASDGSATSVRTAYAFLDDGGGVVASEFGREELEAASASMSS